MIEKKQLLFLAVCFISYIYQFVKHKTDCFGCQFVTYSCLQKTEVHLVNKWAVAVIQVYDHIIIIPDFSCIKQGCTELTINQQPPDIQYAHTPAVTLMTKSIQSVVRTLGWWVSRLTRVPINKAVTHGPIVLSLSACLMSAVLHKQIQCTVVNINVGKSSKQGSLPYSPTFPPIPLARHITTTFKMERHWLSWLSLTIL